MKGDPAFQACEGPILRWAKAARNESVPAAFLAKGLDGAPKRFGQHGLRWAAVNGPTTALLAKCRRLGWQIQD